MRVGAIALLLLTFLVSSVHAQRIEPVQWTFESKQVNGKEYELTFKATIQDGWYIYSQYLESDSGPIPTFFSFNESQAFSLKGKVSEEGEKKEEYDPIFEMKVVKLLGQEVVFKQKLQFNGNPEQISGFLEFMTCNNEICLPPKEVPFSFSF